MTAQHVGPDPRLGCPAGRLPGQPPRRPRRQPGGASDGFGRGSQLVGVGVAGGEDPLGQAVGGEQDLRSAWQAGEASTDTGSLELDEGGEQAPALDAQDLDAARRTRGDGALEVLADAEGREVRGEHQPHRPGEALGRHAGDRRLDRGLGVLHAEHHLVGRRSSGVERRLQAGALGFGPLGERREAADGVVPGHQRRRGARGWAGDPAGCRCSTPRSLRHGAACRRP